MLTNQAKALHMPKTTFLLIHGAWHGGWCWEKILPNLEKTGHTVLAPNLPGRTNIYTPHAEITLSTHVNFLKNLIKNVQGKLVVVGHSFGGVVASQLAEEIPAQIHHLVYVCGFLPENSQSLIEIARSINHVEQPPAMEVNAAGTTITLKPVEALDLFFNCCSPDIGQWATKQLCPEPLIPMTEKVVLSERRFGNIPKTYVVCTQDLALTLQAQKVMSNRAGCHMIDLPTDHSPFLSMPEALTRILLERLW